MNYLCELPSLMVFNDEAHHIHEFKREGEVSEVEWQKSLSLISEPKADRFVQVDFRQRLTMKSELAKMLKSLSFPILWWTSISKRR